MLISRSRLQNAGWPVLFPLACLWAVGARARRAWWSRRERFHSTLPVICVGNLHSGGSGKTPLVIAIAERFSDRKPVVLSRGYRASGAGRVDVSAARGVERFGDEPWMIASRVGCPVYIDSDRRRGLEKIERDRAGGFVLLDDGFQHLPVAPTASLVAIGTHRHPDERFCLPLGDLREPFSALRAASAVVLVSGSGADYSAQWHECLSAGFSELRVFEARRHWESTGPKAVGRLGAFCGIASPERFVADLEANIAKVSWHRAFPDHHAYTDADVDRLVTEGRKRGITHWATTEKDRVKVEARFRAHQQEILTARIRYELSEDFWYFLRSFLEQR